MPSRLQLDTVRRNRQIATQAARRHGINPHLFRRQMRQEAHFQDLTSPAGAQGPAQIMPSTAASWGVRNVHDPRQAYNAAAEHMAGYLHAYGGSWAKALTAYNAGPGAVDGPLPAETQHYIAAILHGRGDHVERPSDQKYSLTARGGTIQKGTAPRIIPGGETVDKKSAMVAALLDPRKKMSLLDRFHQQVDTGNYTTTTPTKVDPGKGARYLQGAKITVNGKTAGAPATRLGPRAEQVDHAVQAAKSYLGVTEVNGTNRGPVVDKIEGRFGMSGEAWCGLFVGTILQKAGVKGVTSRIASTAAIQQDAINHAGPFRGFSRGTAGARRGDLLLVREGGPNGHVEYITGVDPDGTVHTIGGNVGNAVRRQTHEPGSAYGVAHVKYRG